MNCIGKHLSHNKFLDEDMEPWRPTWDLCSQNCHCDKTFDRSLSMFAANAKNDPDDEDCRNMVIVSLTGSKDIKHKLKQCGLIKQQEKCIGPWQMAQLERKQPGYDEGLKDLSKELAMMGGNNGDANDLINAVVDEAKKEAADRAKSAQAKWTIWDILKFLMLIIVIRIKINEFKMYLRMIDMMMMMPMMMMNPLMANP